ncbi:MAG: class I SAM-dependent RNA methyltransferase [Paracoccaceae bacterium]
MTHEPFEIFLATYPGLEDVLLKEAETLRFSNPQKTPGGVVFRGLWPDVWRANLQVRGASRVLARIAEFRAMHPAQLDKRARKVEWDTVLRPDIPVRVEATCKQSRIYHAGAARERVERAITETIGAPVTKDAATTVRVRIEDDLCTISVDTSGALLHQRGHKQAVNKAPLRETLAALLLSKCGFDGNEPVVDPMCGSGTFVLEAAEIHAGHYPGRSRQFAFETFASFEAAQWETLRSPQAAKGTNQFFGFDRDQGAIAMCEQNADRASVSDLTQFKQQAVNMLEPPCETPGLVMVNPPYGARIGNKKMLYGLYASLGERLKASFAGWRVGMITTEKGLARATGLPFADESAPIPNGGLKIRLYQSKTLK